MVNNKLKWKYIIFSFILALNSFINTLPIDLKSATTEAEYKNVNALDEVLNVNIDKASNNINTNVTEDLNNGVKSETNVDIPPSNEIASLTRQNLRPGQEIRSYNVELTIEGESFNGRAVLDVVLSQETREEGIRLFAVGLNIHSVRIGIFTETNAVDAWFDSDGFVLEIFPDILASSYIVIIEYSAQLNIGRGLYMGEYGTDNYLAMNLHPIYARRVFPCIDEPTEVSIISFTVNNPGYTNMVSNSMLEDGTQNQFRALQGPPHLWGLVAHNFVTLNIPTANVLLYGRSGVSNQDSQASVALNSYFHNLNEWTNKPYFEIMVDQDGRMNVIALPDVSRDWHSLSVVSVWEPYILMETTHSVKQRKTSLVKIAETMAKQWFGYVIFPENWRYEWVVSGLATYAGYEMVKLLQPDPVGDVTQLDVNTLFVTDVIQEALLYDAYSSAPVLEPENDIFEEDEILGHVFSKLKYKAPALMRMWRLVLGNEDQDFIQSAARALLAGRSLQTVNSLNFIDGLNSDWMANGNGMVGDIAEFLEPWIWNNGYPLLHVGLRQGGVLITQERFGFSGQSHINYLVPITYTTSNNPDFSQNNIHPIMMMEATTTLNMVLNEEDWVLFNIQGQGYYRVNYDGELWERIIETLENPDLRQQIHPLNRATLVDDALNLARAGRLDYDIAFRVVLSMEHERDYAVWKAFVRNMEFLKKRLEALVFDDEELDPDIYLRMVRRTVGTIENELGFYPDVTLSEPAMDTLTRGLVMEHACRANYQPCIAAAVDWFYDPNNNEQVNPNIPHEIRPAVYCTMVREGDDDVIAALYARLEIEPTQYERVVILESLACSNDENFVGMLLEETLAINSPHLAEERVRIFKAVVESSFQNAFVAMNFISRRSAEIRNRYGGAEKLEELIFIVAENMANEGLSMDFNIWVNAQNNNLFESQMSAERALAQVNENLQWDAAHLDYVYEWIDENHASTMVLSVVALCVSLLVGLLNH